ncbi:tripartite tricarboxylate transporter TctB family protein [Camelimonas abortus]|uniref:Tripartite tricarboxylate transporter TctB family protein n=1 Tax=Camelimonas abortus TaxID=1017184 RepID=A0ABV7LCM4_9HYPH
MFALTGARLTALGLFGAAAAAFWQALQLPHWTFDGPGPGLYPQAVAAACMALALLALALEKPDPEPAAGDDEEAVARYDLAGPQERRTFHIYLAALGVLTAGSWFAGFTLTSLAVIILTMRFGEGVSWRATLVTAFLVTFVFLAGFGWLLQVSLPESAVDTTLRTLARKGGLL